MKDKNIAIMCIGVIILFLIPFLVLFIHDHTKQVEPIARPEITKNQVEEFPAEQEISQTSDNTEQGEKENKYFNLAYDIPLYSIVELSTVPENVQNVVEKMLDEKQEIYFLKKNDFKNSLMILKSVFNDERNTYTRHNLELVEINWKEDNSYTVDKTEMGYSGETNEIVNAPTKFDENNDWQFDKSAEPNRPIKHVKYGENGTTEFTEEWNYTQEEPFKYKMTDRNNNVISILKETADNGMNVKQEHIFYDKHGQITKSITINYEGMNISRISYYNSMFAEINLSFVANYENEQCVSEKIYKNNSELVYVVKATYDGDRRTSVTLFDENNNEITKLLSEN